MSAEHAKAFIERMKTDKEFRDTIMAIEKPVERMEAIKAAGYAFDMAELSGVATDFSEIAGGNTGSPGTINFKRMHGSAGYNPTNVNPTPMMGGYSTFQN